MILNPKEEKEVIQQTIDLNVAWNKGDAKAISAFFTEDGMRVDTFGEIQHGKKEIEASYADFLQEAVPGSRLTQERGKVRFLTPDFATWQGSFEIFAPNNPVPSKGYTSLVMQKVNGKWLILEFHSKIFPEQNR
jgi:uncharacterized protein (TIGR02246 family)